MNTIESKLFNPAPRTYEMSAAERTLRVELAAAFRVGHHYRWNLQINNHITARVPDRPDRFLMNPYGLGWDEITASKLVTIDFTGNVLSHEGVKLAPAGYNFHSGILKALPEIGCVLHTHSLTQTVASRLYAGHGHVHLEGYELLKAFTGNTTHETSVDLPVLPNSQDMTTLAAQVDCLLDRQSMWGYLIDGHGLYAWGRDMAEARRHLEAFEFLLECELELRRLQR